jgi:hypothetical protein
VAALNQGFPQLRICPLPLAYKTGAGGGEQNDETRADVKTSSGPRSG